MAFQQIVFIGAGLFFAYFAQSLVRAGLAWSKAGTLRRFGFFAALAFCAVFLAAGGPNFFLGYFGVLTINALILLQIVNNAAWAIVIAEAIRAVKPSAAAWSEGKHWLIVGSIWLAASAITTLWFSMMAGVQL